MACIQPIHFNLRHQSVSTTLARARASPGSLDRNRHNRWLAYIIVEDSGYIHHKFQPFMRVMIKPAHALRTVTTRGLRLRPAPALAAGSPAFLSTAAGAHNPSDNFSLRFNSTVELQEDDTGRLLTVPRSPDESVPNGSLSKHQGRWSQQQGSLHVEGPARVLLLEAEARDKGVLSKASSLLRPSIISLISSGLIKVNNMV